MYLVVRSLEKQLSFKSDDATLFGSFQRSHQRLQRLLAFVVIEYGSKGALKLTCKNSQVKVLKHRMQVVRNTNDGWRTFVISFAEAQQKFEEMRALVSNGVVVHSRADQAKSNVGQAVK